MKGRIFIRGSTLLGISPALTYHFCSKAPFIILNISLHLPDTL